MRFERKFIFEPYNFGDIELSLLNFGFHNAFPERNVNSIYYDSEDYCLFELSEMGASNRTKIRYRFYNSDYKSACIEFKNRRGELGWKEYIDLIKLKKENNKFINISRSKKFNLTIPSKINSIYSPVIYVQYKRKYFLSLDGKIRVTLDKNIQFSSLNLSKKIDLKKAHLKLEKNILEIKYDCSYKPDHLFIENLTTRFGLQLNKFSKYCEGIKLIK